MGIKKFDSRYLYLCFAAFWCYSFFVSVVFPPFHAYYTYDETFIADSGVFLWYGITPRILDWPASPSVLIYGLIFGCSALYQVVAHAGEINSVLDAFVVVDKTAYEYLFNREPYILAGRAVQMLMILIVGLCTIRFLFRQKHPLLTDQIRGLLSLVLFSSHLIWNSAPVLRPEGIAGIFFIYLLCRLLFSETLDRAAIVVVSMLFALVVAERLIFFILAPLFFSGIFFLSEGPRWKFLRFSVGVFVLSFLAFCPFVLTDPLIIAKAFFGGILAKVNDTPMGGVFNWEFIKTYFNNPVSYLALAVTFLGVSEISRQKKAFYWIVVANWLFFLVIVLRSSKIYDPHVLPAALIHLFLIGFGLKRISEIKAGNWQYAAWGAVLLIVGGEAVSVFNYHTWVRRDVNYHQAVDWIEKELPADAPIATRIDIGLFLAPNTKALSRWIVATEDRENQLNKLRYLMGFNSSETLQLTEDNMSLSAAAFAFEDEKLFALQYQLLHKYGKREKRKRFDLDIFLEDNTLFYHGVTDQEALQRFEAGHYAYWVTDDLLDGREPIKEFSDAEGAPIRVYQNEKPMPAL
jgi:hypothetical protein